MGDVKRIDLANGYMLMLADEPNRWRIVGPDGHDQGYIVSEPDRVEAFARETAHTVEIAAIVARTTARRFERERLHKLVLEMLAYREHRTDIGVRCGIALAARTVLRGRHLTAEEQLRNLAAGLADGDEEGRTADDFFALLTRPDDPTRDRTSEEPRKSVSAAVQDAAPEVEHEANAQASGGADVGGAP